MKGHGETDGSQQPHVLPGRHAQQGLVLRQTDVETKETGVAVSRLCLRTKGALTLGRLYRLPPKV